MLCLTACFGNIFCKRVKELRVVSMRKPVISDFSYKLMLVMPSQSIHIFKDFQFCSSIRDKRLGFFHLNKCVYHKKKNHSLFLKNASISSFSSCFCSIILNFIFRCRGSKQISNSTVFFVFSIFPSWLHYVYDNLLHFHKFHSFACKLPPALYFWN